MSLSLSLARTLSLSLTLALSLTKTLLRNKQAPTTTIGLPVRFQALMPSMDDPTERCTVLDPEGSSPVNSFIL